MSEEGKWKAVKTYRLTEKGKTMLKEYELREKGEAELKKLMEVLNRALDPMSIFKNFSKEYIDEVCRKYKENYDKWALCHQKHCIFHSAYTNYKTFNERCENCDQNDYYTNYVSE